MEKDFNQSIYVYMMFVHKKPLLHVVCEATRYQVEKWLPLASAEELWRVFRLCWVDVYLRPRTLSSTMPARTSWQTHSRFSRGSYTSLPN